MVERAEAHVRSLGFCVLRVRHLIEPDGTLRARVLVGPDELCKLPPVQSAD